MFTFTDMTDEEALRKMRTFREEQLRSNLVNDRRLTALEAENQELKSRLSGLTRLLISKQVFTAAEIAAVIVAVASEAKARLMSEPASPSSTEPESV